MKSSALPLLKDIDSKETRRAVYLKIRTMHPKNTNLSGQRLSSWEREAKAPPAPEQPQQPAVTVQQATPQSQTGAAATPAPPAAVAQPAPDTPPSNEQASLASMVKDLTSRFDEMAKRQAAADARQEKTDATISTVLTNGAAQAAKPEGPRLTIAEKQIELTARSTPVQLSPLVEVYYALALKAAKRRDPTTNFQSFGDWVSDCVLFWCRRHGLMLASVTTDQYEE